MTKAVDDVLVEVLVLFSLVHCRSLGFNSDSRFTALALGILEGRALSRLISVESRPGISQYTP
ncbi:hypothetical protein LBMAG10_15830 [Actinomycetes bacterium]|nr:hypothetical protein LBMAG10_15830 [Actinomycetes bacterium]